MDEKKASDGVEFENRAGQGRAQWNVVKNPALRNPICHRENKCEGGRDRGSFEVLRLAGCVFGQNGHCDVEAREAGETAKDEEGQQKMINRRPYTHREGSSCRGNAEGNLWQKGSVS